MPTLLTHPAVPLAIGLGLGSRLVPPRLLIAGVVACVVPDLDVFAFRFDLGWSNPLRHRGVTHSLSFAALLASFAASFAARLRAPPGTAFLFVLAVTASHGLLDMLTTGGSGIALLWPFSGERFFFPARVIEVSPIRFARFVDAAPRVLASELRWVWLPAAAAALAIASARSHFARRAEARRRGS